MDNLAISAIIALIFIIIINLPTANTIVGYWRNAKGEYYKISKTGFRKVQIAINDKIIDARIILLNNIITDNAYGFVYNRVITWNNNDIWSLQGIRA